MSWPRINSKRQIFESVGVFCVCLSVLLSQRGKALPVCEKDNVISLKFKTYFSVMALGLQFTPHGVFSRLICDFQATH